MEEKRDKLNNPSITALSVAIAFQRALATQYGYLFSKYEAELTAHICDFGIDPIPPLSMNGFFARSLSACPYALQTIFFNKAVGPFYEERIMLRKLMVREKIRLAIINGAKQIVFLGGGYDIRAFISAQEHPDVRFYELDRGITRESKLNAMKSAPYSEFGYTTIKIQELSSTATKINDNLFYLHCDFTTDNLIELLYQYTFNSSQKTLFIGEGLTMYLDEQENQQLLSMAYDLLENPESELLLSYFIGVSQESNLSERAKNNSNEQYKFFLPPQQCASFVAKSGFAIVEKKAPMDMLGDIGKIEGRDYYQISDNRKGKECYYLLKKQKGVFKDIIIEDVPEMSIVIKNPNIDSPCIQM